MVVRWVIDFKWFDLIKFGKVSLSYLINCWLPTWGLLFLNIWNLLLLNWKMIDCCRVVYDLQINSFIKN